MIIELIPKSHFLTYVGPAILIVIGLAGSLMVLAGTGMVVLLIALTKMTTRRQSQPKLLDQFLVSTQGITGHPRSADAETKRSWRASGGRLRERWRRKE